jgi:large repetitive protein
MRPSQTVHDLTRNFGQIAAALAVTVLAMLAAPDRVAAAGYATAGAKPFDAEPPISAASGFVTAEDTPLALVIPLGDVSYGMPVLSLAELPAHGKLTGTLPNVTYTPDADYYGVDSFTVVAHNRRSSSGAVTTELVTTTFAIEVLAVNDAPIAVGGESRALPPFPLTLTLAADDADGDPLTFTIVTPPQQGTLSGTGPHLVYTPAADFEGTDTLTFIADDGQSISNVATVTIKYVPLGVTLVDEPSAAGGIYLPLITR